MSRLCTTQALILKTYDIGDADRFCIVLTEAHGRITVTAKGVRKLTSKFGGAVQSFQHLKVDLAEHSSGHYLRSAECIDSFSDIRHDMQKYVMASRGAELLLHFLHDTEPAPAIFHLAKDYFEQCHQNSNNLLFPTFQLMLMKELGLLPSLGQDVRHTERSLATCFDSALRFAPGSAQHDVSGAKSKYLASRDTYSQDLNLYLRSNAPLPERATTVLSSSDKQALNTLCDQLLRDHLSFPLKSSTSLTCA